MKVRVLLWTALAISTAGCEDAGERPAERNSLVVSEDAVELNGYLTLQTTEVAASDVSIGLRWNIPDGTFPAVATTTTVEGISGEETFRAVSDVRPPDEALQPSESNGRAGLAIGYVVAFVDGNDNGALDCRNPGDCDDVFVGASPNTLVLFGDEEQLTDFSPIFDFNGEAGIVPKVGWSLVHLIPNECEVRPTARDWNDSDGVEVIVIGDFLTQDRCSQRMVIPDID